MVARLVEFINQQHGTAFAPHGRYPTGEQGAFAVSEANGDCVRRLVLKWGPGTEIPGNLRQAAAIAARLRTVGYPAPRYRLLGVAQPLQVVYSLQEELPGTPLEGRLDRPLLDRLLELNALQRKQAIPPFGTWPKPVADPVLHGGDGYCLLDPLRSYSAATATLLDVVQRLVITGMGEPSPTADAVHFDFQGSNILVDREEISGVVDWEGSCSGDRAFDLATLFFYAGASEEAEADQIERLWRLLVAETGPRLLGVYLAHLILRQVDWSIRFHDGESVAHWLGHTDDVLRRLLALTEADGSV
jgi:hypothetical protein